MAYVLLKAGIRAQKAWAISSVRLKRGSRKLCPPLLNSQDHPITWDVHVAPAIHVDVEGVIPVQLVIDPATSRSLQNQNDWHRSMNDDGSELWLSPTWVYRLKMVDKRKDSVLDFSDSYFDDDLILTMIELARLRRAGAAVRRYRNERG